MLARGIGIIIILRSNPHAFLGMVLILKGSLFIQEWYFFSSLFEVSYSIRVSSNNSGVTNDGARKKH
jgi:hypothetical protein